MSIQPDKIIGPEGKQAKMYIKKYVKSKLLG